MMKRVLGSIILITGLLLAVSSATAQKKLYLVYSQYFTTTPFFTASGLGFAEQCKRRGHKYEILDAGINLQRQMDQISNAITKKPDAIVITPYDSDALSESVIECNKAGIPVFTIDRSISRGNIQCILQSDNVEAGRKVAREIVRQIKLKKLKKVILLEVQGQLGSSPARDRHQGFWEIVGMYPDIEIELVGNPAADWLPEKGMQVTASYLASRPDINVIFYHADAMAPGVFAAMTEAGRNVPQSDPKHIINGGVDGNSFACDAVRKGLMDVAISQMPYSQGIQVVNFIEHVIQFGMDKGELPPQLFFDTQVLTPENIKQFKGLWGDLPMGGAGFEKFMEQVKKQSEEALKKK